MSDVAAVYILDYLENNFYYIINKHRQLYLYFNERVGVYGKILTTFSEDVPFVSCLAVVTDVPINEKIFVEKGIYCRKYYTPLEPLKKSVELQQHIICFPCHVDMTFSDIDNILNIFMVTNRVSYHAFQQT
jgi:CTP:phosphocholine cytidylyltransferase-like protein